MKHPVVWFEVMGNNGDELRAFYEKVFHWKIDTDNPMNYGMVEAEKGRGIPGGVGQLTADDWPRVTFYVSTNAVDESLQRATQLGGKVLRPRTELPGGTVLGLFQDPEGNAIGLVEDGEA